MGEPSLRMTDRYAGDRSLSTMPWMGRRTRGPDHCGPTWLNTPLLVSVGAVVLWKTLDGAIFARSWPGNFGLISKLT